MASDLGLQCLLRLICPNIYGKYGITFNFTFSGAKGKREEENQDNKNIMALILSPYLIYKVLFTSEPHHKTYHHNFVPSRDLDQPVLSGSMIRIFTEQILDSQGCKVSSCGQ